MYIDCNEFLLHNCGEKAFFLFLGYISLFFRIISQIFMTFKLGPVPSSLPHPKKN